MSTDESDDSDDELEEIQLLEDKVWRLLMTITATCSGGLT